MLKLRPYQERAVESAVSFFKQGGSGGLIVLPTGAGKSLVIANIALRLGEPILVLQPSKEILEQNFQKLADYGYYDIGIFSASLNRKQISTVTFATIGSVNNAKAKFGKFNYCIIDECHFVDPQKGMYNTFLRTSGIKVVGLTATPYRLYSSRNFGSMLRFITRTRPRIFSRLLYSCQIGELLRQGFLSPLNYYEIKCIDTSQLIVNSIYTDYTDASVKAAYRRIDFSDKLTNIVERLLVAKRTHILVFTRFVEEARFVANKVGKEAAIVDGSMPKAEREKVLADFKRGLIKVVANVGVLTTGFDFPELDTIVIGRPTMSLALYYQMVGRAIRPAANKVGWIVDLCGSYTRFGEVKDLELRNTEKGQLAYFSRGKQLTNVFFQR